MYIRQIQTVMTRAIKALAGLKLIVFWGALTRCFRFLICSLSLLRVIFFGLFIFSIVSVFFSQPAWAKDIGVIGPVYPIAETDLLD